MLFQFKVISNSTRLVIHSVHCIEASLLSRIFSRLTKSCICRIGTFINASMNDLTCRIHGNSHNDTTFILDIINRHRQTSGT